MIFTAFLFDLQLSPKTLFFNQKGNMDVFKEERQHHFLNALKIFSMEKLLPPVDYSTPV